jgi:glycosyltransferase involved in cell wall biosynthesis
MRILFVLAYYHPYVGGAERIFKRLTEGLAARGHQVAVLTTHLPGTPHHECLNGVAIRRVATPRRGDRYFFSLLGLLPALQAALHYDVVHTTAYNGAPPAFLAARLARRPIVFTALEVLGKRWHTVAPGKLNAYLYRAFEQAVVRLPYDRLVSISQTTQGDLLRAGVPAQRSSVLPCGVDEVFVPGPPAAERPLRRHCGAQEGDFLYTYVGRPGITKGVEYLLQAAPAIQQHLPKAHLALIMADEPREQYDRLRAQAAALAGQARIHFIPPMLDRQALVAHLRDSDCVVVPSLTEGFGLSAAEACSLGLPVVATRAGSLPEVVFGQHILIEPASAPAISTAVVRAAHGDYDPYVAPRSYRWETMVAGYEALYKELLP